MIKHPSEGLISVVDKDERRSEKSFICVFSDETESPNARRYHENVSGDTSIHDIYQLVCRKMFVRYLWNICEVFVKCFFQISW